MPHSFPPRLIRKYPFSPQYGFHEFATFHKEHCRVREAAKYPIVKLSPFGIAECDLPSKERSSPESESALD